MFVTLQVVTDNDGWKLHLGHAGSKACYQRPRVCILGMSTFAGEWCKKDFSNSLRPFSPAAKFARSKHFAWIVTTPLKVLLDPCFNVEDAMTSLAMKIFRRQLAPNLRKPLCPDCGCVLRSPPPALGTVLRLSSKHHYKVVHGDKRVPSHFKWCTSRKRPKKLELDVLNDRKFDEQHNFFTVPALKFNSSVRSLVLNFQHSKFPRPTAFTKF